MPQRRSWDDFKKVKYRVHVATRGLNRLNPLDVMYIYQQNTDVYNNIVQANPEIAIDPARFGDLKAEYDRLLGLPTPTHPPTNPNVLNATVYNAVGGVKVEPQVPAASRKKRKRGHTVTTDNGDNKNGSNHRDEVRQYGVNQKMKERYGVIKVEKPEDYILAEEAKDYVLPDEVPIGVVKGDKVPQRVVVATLNAMGSIVIRPINFSAEWHHLYVPSEKMRWPRRADYETTGFDDLHDKVDFGTGFRPLDYGTVQNHIIKEVGRNHPEICAQWGWIDSKDIRTNRWLGSMSDNMEKMKKTTRMENITHGEVMVLSYAYASRMEAMISSLEECRRTWNFARDEEDVEDMTQNLAKFEKQLLNTLSEGVLGVIGARQNSSGDIIPQLLNIELERRGYNNCIPAEQEHAVHANDEIHDGQPDDIECNADIEDDDSPRTIQVSVAEQSIVPEHEISVLSEEPKL